MGIVQERQVERSVQDRLTTERADETMGQQEADNGRVCQYKGSCWSGAEQSSAEQGSRHTGGQMGRDVRRENGGISSQAGWQRDGREERKGVTRAMEQSREQQSREKQRKTERSLCFTVRDREVDNQL